MDKKVNIKEAVIIANMGCNLIKSHIMKKNIRFCANSPNFFIIINNRKVYIHEISVIQDRLFINRKYDINKIDWRTRIKLWYWLKEKI